MGWLWKAFGLFLAIILYGVGAWPLSLLIFAVLFLPPIARALRRRHGGEKGGGGFPWRPLAAGLLFFLALLGLAARGTYSPIFFAGLGALVLAWGRIGSLPGLSLKPVEGSILLRSSPLPVSWVAVAEVKAVTRDLGRALAGIDGTILVSAAGDTTVHLVVETRAFGEREAEGVAVKKLGEMARSLAPLGAYLLPLDSSQAFSVLSLGEKVSLGRNWSNFLASGAYDSVSISQERGFAKSLGAFRAAAEKGGARVPAGRRDIGRPPFLMEVYKAMSGRTPWPGPDRYAAFLSSLVATAGEPVGTRILDSGAGTQAVVVVRSQGSPEVELSRAQLRAVARMYESGALRG